MLQEIIKAPDESFVWIDVTDPTQDELIEIMQKYGLHKTSIQDCVDPKHLPKYEMIDDTRTFIMLRAYDELCPESSNNIRELTRKIAIFFTNNYLITVRRSNQPFFLKLLERWKMNQNYQNLLPRILISIIHGVLASYEVPINLCHNKLEEFEEKLFSEEESHSGLIQDKFIEKRKAYVFKRMIKLSLEILPKLKFISEFSSTLYQDLKESADGLYFYADDLIEYVNNLINLHLSLASHNTNAIVRTLTIFSVFFMPLTFIVGVYGMNFEYMPELEYHWGYPLVLLGMLLMSIFLRIWFVKKKWIR